MLYSSAGLTLYRTDGKDWYPEASEDPDTNVWHKAMAWRDGILTLGANGTDAPPRTAEGADCLAQCHDGSGQYS